MRTIRVTGKGNIKVRPDQTRLTMTLLGTCKEYAAALKHAADKTKQLKMTLSEYGFDHEDVKTLSFDVSPKYKREPYSDEAELIGYQYEHELKVEFDSDNERLGKILYALARGGCMPRLQISYIVKDEEALKNEVLGRAVEDAKAKAVVLTLAAGLELKDIQNIDYSWKTIDFEVCPVPEFMAAPESSIGSNPYQMDMEPDDVDVSDTVTVIWEVE